MTRKILFSPVLVVLTLIFGCNNSPDDRFSNPTAVHVEDDDPEMIAAIETAKETFPLFEKNWKTMQNDGYSLKFAVPTADGELEHIWFSPTKIEGDKITGECANDPLDVPGLKLGDVRTVSRADVSDWMIMVGNKCYGGFTIRALLKRDPDVAPPFEFKDFPTD